LGSIAPPPFANIPQHDYDHNCSGGYTHEVEEDLKGLAKEISDAGHDIKPEDIAGELDSRSSTFRSTLQARGGRQGGTHAGWQMGLSEPQSRWYVPFSMASDGCLTEKGFPVRKFDERVAKWIQRIASAMGA
jgi:hypothetical protein